MDSIVGDKGEGICRCRIRVDVHPKLCGDIVCRALQRAVVIAARDKEEEEGAGVRGKGAREGAEAGARFGRSASSSPPRPPEGDGGRPLILIIYATHVISAIWCKRRSSGVEVNAEDRVRAEAGDDDNSSLSSSPPPPVSRFTGSSDRRRSIGKTSTA